MEHDQIHVLRKVPLYQAPVAAAAVAAVKKIFFFFSNNNSPFTVEKYSKTDAADSALENAMLFVALLAVSPLYFIQSNDLFLQRTKR